MSIRLRIVISMGLCFLLTAAVTIAWVVSVNEFSASQAFLERFVRYEFELEQARRFEKNYLLYKTDLDEALADFDAAEQILDDAGDAMANLVGREAFARIGRNLDAYGSDLEKLKALAAGTAGDDALPEVERALRQTGAKAIEDASDLVNRERLRVDTIVRTTKIVAAAGLIIVLLVLAFVANHLARQILAPLARFVTYTQRIAGRDYSPILPVRRYKDEFSDLGIAVNRMVAHIKSNEAQLARSSRMAAVGTLTAGIAHEINNPLNNIGLTVETLLDAGDDYDEAEKAKMLRDVYTQVERASATVRNLLDFTREERQILVPVDVESVVREGTRLVANEARIGDVEIAIELPADLPSVQGSPRGLQQVFLNLLLNAIQAMPRGGRITVRGRVQGDMVRVEVADTGDGIAEEHLSSIFDPFFTTKEVGAGSGLGLSVSYGIIEKHHGRLEVESQVGVGTTFILSLPSEGAEGPPAEASRS